MDNKDFDKKIRESIKQFDEIPLCVEEKIQQAYKKIDNIENQEEGGKGMKKFSKILSIAATLLVVMFLAGNGVAYAKGENNIYSWVLEKLGIQKEYDEIKKDINQAAESNGVKVTLMDIGYDDNFLVIGYKIQAEKLCDKIYEKGYFNIDEEVVDKDSVKYAYIEQMLKMQYQAKITSKNQETYLGTYISDDSFTNDVQKIDVPRMFWELNNIVSNDEIIMYHVCDISEENLANIINIDIQIDQICLNMIQAEPSVFEGKWTYSVENLEKNKEMFKEYKLNNNKIEFKMEKEYGWAWTADGTKQQYEQPMVIVKDEYGIAEVVIDEIRVAKMGAIVKLKTNFENGVMVDESILRPYYAFELIDSKGNIILEKQTISETCTFFTEKLKEKENYKVNIYKYYERQIPDGSQLEYNCIASMDIRLDN